MTYALVDGRIGPPPRSRNSPDTPPSFAKARLRGCSPTLVPPTVSTIAPAGAAVSSAAQALITTPPASTRRRSPGAAVRQESRRAKSVTRPSSAVRRGCLSPLDGLLQELT